MRRLAVPLLAIALFAAGCGGDDDKDAAKTSEDSTTTSSTAAETTTTTVPGTAPGAPAGPNATGTGQGATATTAKSSSGSGGSGGSGTNTAAPANKNLKPAAAGRYSYNRTGNASTSAFGSRSLDGPVSLQVDPPNGNEQRAVQSGPEGGTEQILRLMPEGAYFVYIKQSNSGLSKEFRPNPAVLAVPEDAKIGRTWSWTMTSTDGATTLNGTFKIERTETVTVGGEKVPTHVLSVVLKASGDIEMTTNQTSWVALGRGLIVKSDQTSDGRFGNVTFNSQSSMSLTSMKPA